jgi:hypothetical protein
MRVRRSRCGCQRARSDACFAAKHGVSCPFTNTGSQPTQHNRYQIFFLYNGVLIAGPYLAALLTSLAKTCEGLPISVKAKGFAGYEATA